MTLEESRDNLEARVLAQTRADSFHYADLNQFRLAFNTEMRREHVQGGSSTHREVV